MQDVGRTREEFVNHEPQVSDLRILLVFCPHPKWFISLYTIETCGLLLLYNNNNIHKTHDFSMGSLAQ